MFEMNGQFRFKVIGGHTKGSSAIYFNEGEVQYVISGDETYLVDNFDRQIPSGNVCNLDRNREFIHQVHNQGIVPLPSHDASILQKYPKISEHVVRII
jgi:glyoxylase-like metal-dependent hydrolase (beta-lactamase superfamily II)